MAHKMVIHAENYKKGAVGALEKHNFRKNETYSNKDIDHTRTKDNVILKMPEVSQYQDTKSMIEQRATNQVRSTSIWQTEFIISSDQSFFQELPMEEQNRFFRDAYNYLSGEFGSQNVVCAVVHYDETTPHMHFDFVPMTETDKLSRKEVMTRERLLKIQDKLPQKMSERGFQIERGVKTANLDKNERPRHLDHKEYKNRLEGQINALEGQINSLHSHRINLIQQNEKKRQEQLRQISEENKKIDLQEKALESRKEKLQFQIKEHNSQIGQIKELPKGETTFTGKVVLKEEDYRKLYTTAKKGVVLESEYRASVKNYQELSANYEKLKEQVPTMKERMEVAKLKSEYKNLVEQNRKMKAVLEKLAGMDLPVIARRLIESIREPIKKVLDRQQQK